MSGKADYCIQLGYNVDTRSPLWSRSHRPFQMGMLALSAAASVAVTGALLSSFMGVTRPIFDEKGYTDLKQDLAFYSGTTTKPRGMPYILEPRQLASGVYFGGVPYPSNFV